MTFKIGDKVKFKRGLKTIHGTITDIKNHLYMVEYNVLTWSLNVICGSYLEEYELLPDTIPKWDQRFLDLAKLVASWSNDPSTKVAAVITRGKRIVSMGFNGFPAGIKDDKRLQDREIKNSFILHAEDNALLFAKQDLTGCSIFTYPFMPCASCSSKIIQAGITRVISIYI